jgi:hypothetical protein
MNVLSNQTSSGHLNPERKNIFKFIFNFFFLIHIWIQNFSYYIVKESVDRFTQSFCKEYFVDYFIC